VPAESNPLIRAKRRAGRVKRAIRRKLHERTIGTQYRAWLAQAAGIEAGSVDNAVPIAVIVPVFNPPVAFLQQCLDSVLAQSARNWRLIVSDDGSDRPDVIAYLDAFTAQHANDPRIVVVRAPNGGIAAACNRGLEQVRTDYFGWLDHDDLLDPRCFAEFARVIEQHDQQEERGAHALDIVYSDEDKVDTKGRHFELNCKPDYSPELLLAQMYLCHFTVFRTALVREHGGFRSEMDGAQDFDLALRLMPDEARVHHIPLPLYHWRAWSESTALTIEAKPWAQEAGARAQQSHLDRVFGGGTVTPSRVRGLNEVHPRIQGHHRVSVIIPTIGTPNVQGNGRFIDDCVRSLVARETETALEIIVVTTGVIPDVRIESVGEHSLRHVVYETSEFNFAEAINRGRESATGDFLLLLNDDTTVAESNPVTRMLELGQLPGVGIVGAKLTYPNGRLQHIGLILLPSGPTHPFIGAPGSDYGYFGSALTPRNYSAVTAAAMLVRTDLFDALSGFDTAFARDFNDVDFCLRAGQRGSRIAWTPYAHLIHHEGASIVRRKPDPAEQALFAARWGTLVDSYYSPALNPRLDRIYEAL
jgi:GT2 family glycosyltransferase